MPLDPQVESFLDRMRELGVPGIGELPPDEARAVGDEAAATVFGPVPVVAWEDRSVPGPAGAIPVRVYRPGDHPAPVLVYFHGGGWVLGSLNTHHGVCASLAALSGCVVCSVDYRMAPEHRFPAAVEDAWAATTWLAEHAEEVGGRAGALAVGGDSAGGNLAAVCALRARDTGLRLALQLLVYPVIDADLETSTYREFAEGYFLTERQMDWYRERYLRRPEDTLDWRASPLLADDLAGAAPAYVAVAGFDPLRDEGLAYAERLREAGVPVEVHRAGSLIHAYVNITAVSPDAREATMHAVRAIRRATAGR